MLTLLGLIKLTNCSSRSIPGVGGGDGGKVFRVNQQVPINYSAITYRFVDLIDKVRTT